MTALLAALALHAAVVAAAPCTLPPLAGAPPWRPGESLSFDVDLLGVVRAGTLSSTVEDPTSGGAVIPLRARMKNLSVFAKVRRVRAVATSWVDARTLRPQRYRDDSEENGVHRSTEARLDAPGSKVSVAWSLGDKRGRHELERQGDVLDLLSAVYYLRATRLGAGDLVCVDLLANRRYWRLEGKLATGTERVETPAGTFQAVRLDATLTRLATPDDPKVKSRPLHLWFSTDARRLPVAAVSELDQGPVRALLARGAKPREPNRN